MPQARVAQLVEQCFRKAEVVGPIPTPGSRKSQTAKKRQSCGFDVFLLEFGLKMNPEMNQKPTQPPVNKWQLAQLAFDMGFIIALPLVGLGLLGKYLDGKLGSDPWLTLAGVVLAITATTIWLTQKFKNFIKK
jgi:hypothetical protein